MVSRVILPESCKEDMPLSTESINVDKQRVNYIVSNKLRGVNERKWLGSIWLVLDPIANSLVYLLVLSVVRSNPNPESLFMGISMFSNFRRGFSSGVASITDFSGGLADVERVRTRVLVRSKLKYRIIDSFLGSFGVCLLLIFYLGMDLEPVIVFFILSQLVGIMGEGVALNASMVTKRVPDVKNLINYFMTLMFFGSPVLYPMSKTYGIHYRINEFNPFSYFIEAARYAAEIDSVFSEFDIRIFIPLMITLVFLHFRGYYSIDKYRWEVSTWS